MLPELEDELDLEEALELEPLFARRGAIAQRFLGKSWGAHEFEALPIPRTTHMLDCADCPLLPAARCITVVRQAIIEAINLAKYAADKVDSATKPGPRDEKAEEAARLFKAFFGHDPSWPVPWANNEKSGVSVAKRFQAVARELAGGRRIVFRCLPARADCANTDLTCCDTDSRAWSRANENVVRLCPPFWNLPEASRGGTILHEMLHVLFDFLGDEGRRANAHCYKAFALRIRGYGRDLEATCACWDLPPDAECRRRLGLPPA